MTRAVGYVRVSTAEQGASGLGLADQREAILREARHRNWEIRILQDVQSARNIDRPALTEVRRLLRSGQAQVLVVSKLDRLTRSVIHFATLMEEARKEHWEMVLLDLNVDTTAPTGRLLAQILASFAQWEREIISQRTRLALAQKRARGFRLGAPIAIPDEEIDYILRCWDRGEAYNRIATRFNDMALAAPKGGEWGFSSIRRVVERARRKQAA